MKRFLLLFCFLAGPLFSQEFGGRGVISLNAGANLGGAFGSLTPGHANPDVSAFTGIEGGFMALFTKGPLFLYGSDTRLGLRFQNLPQGWNNGDYNFQFYFSGAFMIGVRYDDTSFLVDTLGFTVGFQPQKIGGSNYNSVPTSIILPLGFHIITDSGFYLGLRHELYFSYYHNSEYVSSYNIFTSIGWVFGDDFDMMPSRRRSKP